MIVGPVVAYFDLVVFDHFSLLSIAKLTGLIKGQFGSLRVASEDISGLRHLTLS